MAEERERVAPGDLARWVVLGLVVVVGLALYLMTGIDAEPVARPHVLEAEP